MKKRHYKASILIGFITLCSCTSGLDWNYSDYSSSSSTGSTSNGSSSSAGTSLTGMDDLSTYTIEINKTALEEEENIPASESDTYYEDYVENYTPTNTITITYNGTSASCSGSVDGVSVAINGADVTVTSTAKNIKYVLSGTTTDGSFKMASGDDNKKFELELDGVNITNNDGPALNIQVGKRCYIVAKDGTTNTFTDGTSYTSSTEDQKATIFSEGELLFSGSGTISVYANSKAGIVSDDYVFFRPNTNIYVKSTAGNGIKGNDGLIIKGGVINVETSAAASKALSSDGYTLIEGGRTTAITTGTGAYEDNEVSGCAALKSDSLFTMTSGELNLKSTGSGGKGLSADQEVNVSGGTIKVITTGSTYKYGSDDSKAKGIKADGNLTISGGTVYVRANGGSGSEGIETKSKLYISGGTTKVYAYDDGINSSSDMYISGGEIFSFGLNNDGLDSNGNMYISGGTTIAYGTSSPETGIDVNSESNKVLYITGGIVVGIGGTINSPSSTSNSQPIVTYSGKISSGSSVSLKSGDSTLLNFEMARDYSSATFMLSAPGMTSGSSYSLYNGTSLISTLTASYTSSSSIGGGMNGRFGGW